MHARVHAGLEARKQPRLPRAQTIGYNYVHKSQCNSNSMCQCNSNSVCNGACAHPRMQMRKRAGTGGRGGVGLHACMHARAVCKKQPRLSRVRFQNGNSVDTYSTTLWMWGPGLKTLAV
eukprot:356034-Chlamydomonas_euryale.AAC.3